MADGGVTFLVQDEDSFFKLSTADMCELSAEEYRELQVVQRDLRAFISNYKKRRER
jgi:hypothetical protein